jgi:hypothetical protein
MLIRQIAAVPVFALAMGLGCGGIVAPDVEQTPDANGPSEGGLTDATASSDAADAILGEVDSPSLDSSLDSSPDSSLDAPTAIDSPSGDSAEPDAPPEASSFDAGDAGMSSFDAGIFCGRPVCGPEGNTQCVAGEVETCVTGDGGCLEWGPPAACGIGLNCNWAYTCVPPSCTDGTKDDGETGVDCGGPCPACVGEPCSADRDCATDACNLTFGLCAGTPCADGHQDERETDVDCGGVDSCARCQPGKRCVDNTDCRVGYRCDVTMHICR